MKTIPRLLVVDDDANLRKTLADILRLKGYQVLVAETGAQGVAQAAGAFVNVALIDLKLPDLPGIEVMERIKRATPLTEAIILTGHASLDTAVEATNKGAISYLIKPYEVERLLRHIQRALERQQAQQEILRLASFPRMNPNPVIEVDAAGVLTYLNPAAERLFPGLAAGLPAPAALGDLPAAAASGEQPEAAREVSVGSGTFEQFTCPVPHGELIRVYLLDISQRKQDELALASANRALRTLSACNEMMVRAGNETELLDSICRLIVETGGYRMAWVGVPEQDAAKTVRVLAQHGNDDGYLAAANISWADCERGRGPSGSALRTGTVQVNQSYRHNPAVAPWREAALERGYQSSIALPLKGAGGTFGVLTLYAGESTAFDEAEVTLLKDLAEDLAYGIETRRTRAERDRIAAEQLHQAEMLRQALQGSIKAIANTVEMRDPYTAGHQRRVGQLAIAIARELGLSEKAIHGIGLAASIHDLGKISVPAEILSKPSKLTAIEFMLLRNHAQAGFDILKDIEFPWPIASMVLQHHERLDGSGYPQGLKGDQILLESRILAVADVVEAMASHRPYRAALGTDSALKEIERGRGMVYDAAVVDACQRLFTQKRFAWSDNSLEHGYHVVAKIGDWS